jgi:hypothetical protein
MNIPEGLMDTQRSCNNGSPQIHRFKVKSVMERRNKNDDSKINHSKKSIPKKNEDGTLKSIVHGEYDPIKMVSYRSKNNKSSSLLPNNSLHYNSKTVFDWKHKQMKKLNAKNFCELSFDTIDFDKKKRFKKNTVMTNSLDKLPYHY